MEIEIVRSFLETIHDGFVVGGVFVEGLGYTEKQREIEKYDGRDVILKLEVRENK